VDDRPSLADALAAGAVAAVLSGAPSTSHALLTDRDPLEASLAAGTLLLAHERRPTRLLAAAAVAHVALSLGWAVVLAAVLPRRHAIPAAAAAGLGIAALDLGVVGRHFERIRALPLAPQVLDHVAYAVTVAVVLQRRRRRAGATPPARSRAARRGRPGPAAAA
jgi:hypothetical protein